MVQSGNSFSAKKCLKTGVACSISMTLAGNEFPDYIQVSNYVFAVFYGLT
jgi:hypothetical protein